MSNDESAEAVSIAVYGRVSETAYAVCFRFEPGFGGRRAYVPKSLLLDEDDEAKLISVPRWWAEQEGFDYED